MKREASKIIFKGVAIQREQNGECPSCGLYKTEWARYYHKFKTYRQNYRCCSPLCTKIFYSDYVIATSWNDFRYQIFVRDDFTCLHCKNVFVVEDLICDHIVPIAIGGLQWDSRNLQTLCKWCNKIKTKNDMGDIAKARRACKTKKMTATHARMISLFHEAIKEGDYADNTGQSK